MQPYLRTIEHPIILLEGGTGVGTSVFSMRLAAALDIPVVVNTDCIREVLRTAIASSANPALNLSTYLAGRTKTYRKLPAHERRHQAIHGYKMQCSPIQAGVDRIVKRAIRENRSVLIEGVHLHPGRIREAEWYDQADNRIVELYLYIDDPHVHLQRFQYRQQKAPQRPFDMYFDNFEEIRWIHDYLCMRAKRFDDVQQINNVGTADDCFHALVDVMRSYCPQRMHLPM
jgi:2-phosphoglycerate kinase